MANEREIAHQTQEKFEFYLLGLVFTLLVLSVQTATLHQSNLANFCELLAWFSLLTSGVVGLWRMEYSSVWRTKIAIKSDYENKIDELREFMHTHGVKEIPVLETKENESIEERIQKYQEAITLLDPLLVKLESQNSWKYQIHRFGFVIGLFLLLVSRGFEHITNLIKAIL